MRIKEKRIQMGISQVELAEKCQCSQGHISDIEKGKQSPSPSLAKKIADILGIDIMEILFPENGSVGKDRKNNDAGFFKQSRD